MRMLLASTSAAFGLILSASLGGPANADAVATRCGPQGCDHIKCHNDGNFCVRFSDYDPRYNGYIGAGVYASGNGGYGGYSGNGYYGSGYYGSGNSGNGYYGNGYAGNSYNGSRYVGNEYAGTGAYAGNGDSYYGGNYGAGTYGGYGANARIVCDSLGDRCYTSYTPYWDYREYYRRHGYHWNF